MPTTNARNNLALLDGVEKVEVIASATSGTAWTLIRRPIGNSIARVHPARIV